MTAPEPAAQTTTRTIDAMADWLARYVSWQQRQIAAKERQRFSRRLREKRGAK